jgi:MoxR-like ATPase
MEKQSYIADDLIATTIYLALRMKKPILIEGEPGSGKTEIAKVLAKMLGTELIRLQCYEGLDANMALYEWDYPRQMLRIRMEEANKSSKEEIESAIFSERYLLERPLLKAITYGDKPAVLLIDEIDRAEDEFEGFLLEVLSEFQVSIPEIGTITAKNRPVVCLTSNESREIGDALKRRCLYLYIQHPTFEKEYKIIRTKVPEVPEKLASQICSFMQEVRSLGLVKKPGLAETLDWAAALLSLSEDELDLQTLQRTLSCMIKHKEDFKKVNAETQVTILTEIKRKKEAPNLGPRR